MNDRELKDEFLNLMNEYFILDDSPESLNEEQERTFVNKLDSLVSQSNDKIFVDVKKTIRRYKLNKINNGKL